MIVRDLSITLNNKKLLENINIEFERGIRVIYGESGVGKTLLMVSIAGLNDFFKINAEGEVYADCSLLFEDTDNQIIGYRVKDEIEIAGIDRKYLGLLGLEGYDDREVHTLSGGELKKLCIAEALSKNRKDIILDDPQSHLDSESFKELLEILKELSGEKAILILTRRPDYYADCNHYLLRKDGLRKGVCSFYFKKIRGRSEGGKRLIVEGRDVTFSYGDKPIFNKVSFKFFSGISIITGKNGSGKTTLLKIISGLLNYGGSIKFYVDGEKTVSYVHQFPERVFFYSSVREEAEFALGDLCSEILEVFKLNPEKKIKDMTRREKALLAIACSMNAEVVCLDEPTASLDISGVNILLEAIESFDRNYIIASNDQTFVKSLSEVAEIYRLEAGVIKNEGHN